MGMNLPNDKQMRLIAALIIFTTAMIYISFCTFMTLPKGGERIADTTVGFLLGTCIGSLIAYYWGTSHSSSEKNETIKRMSQKDTYNDQETVGKV